MGKRVLLIGGNSGIGACLCDILIEKGWEIVSISRSRKNLSSNVEFIEHDIADFEKPLPQLEGHLDGLVYLPGSINLKPFKQLKIEDFYNDLHINYLGAVRVIKSYLEQLGKDAQSSIVLMSSVAATVGLTFHASIASAKAAIEGFSRALAAELAPAVRVNVVAPSITNTPMASKLLDTPLKKEHSVKSHPLKGIAEPEHVAPSIAYLLSDESRWVTGQILHVDGGFSNLKPL